MLCLLWCKEDDIGSSSVKDVIFKELTRDNAIKFLIEKMVRIATILVYGRLRDFGINANTILIDYEFDALNYKIKQLVEIVYNKMQINEESVEQSEVEKKIRIPRYMYDPPELRKKLNTLTFQPDQASF